MTAIKKDQVIPGIIVEVVYDGKRGYTSAFILNAHCMLTNPSSQLQLLNGVQLKVLSKPKKKDNINLVEVLCNGVIGQVYYTDLVSRCKVIISES